MTRVTPSANPTYRASRPVDPAWKINEACVNKQLQIGKPLGRFGPTNNCQTFVQETLDQCSTIPEDKRPKGVW